MAVSSRSSEVCTSAREASSREARRGIVLVFEALFEVFEAFEAASWAFSSSDVLLPDVLPDDDEEDF